jgi:hypothetical protein
MKKLLYIFFAVSIIFSACKKEEGCTDSLATNFNIDAEDDDGSCVFGIAGGSWITQSIEATGSMTVSIGGFPFLDSTLNIVETNPDSLDPYKLTFADNGLYTEYDNLDNAVEGGTWSVSGDQLTINTPDTTLLLMIESVDRDNAVLSLDIVESSNDNGVTIDIDITQTINSIREW